MNETTKINWSGDHIHSPACGEHYERCRWNVNSRIGTAFLVFPRKQRGGTSITVTDRDVGLEFDTENVHHHGPPSPAGGRNELILMRDGRVARSSVDVDVGRNTSPGPRIRVESNRVVILA